MFEILLQDRPGKIQNSNRLNSLFEELDQDLELQYEEEEFEFYLMGKEVYLQNLL